MSVEENKAIIRRYWHELWNEKKGHERRKRLAAHPLPALRRLKENQNTLRAI
jgi:hypothetical protein